MSPKDQAKVGVFIEMPCGFQESGKVLKTRRLLYGLHQSTMLWFKHLKSKLENVGFQQVTEIDPCLFVSVLEDTEPRGLCATNL